MTAIRRAAVPDRPQFVGDADPGVPKRNKSMDTRNEPGHETIKAYVLSGNKRIEAVFILNDNPGYEVELTLKFAGHSYKAHAPTYFEAMNKIRLILEKDDIYPICYGTCENTYPSGTTISASTGRTAFRCTLGRPAINKDIVDIFGTDGSCTPVAVLTQKQFNLKWRESITFKKTRKKIRIGSKFRNACFIICVALWVSAFAYYFLKGDDTDGGIMFIIIMLGCLAVFVPALPIFEPMIKPDSKTRKSMVIIPVEKQLRLLAELGIKLRQEVFFKWIHDEWSIETLELNPYSPLLFSYGNRRLDEQNKKWEWLSDDAYTFDTECVEGYDLYAAVFERLGVLSKGIFDVKNVSGEINHELKNASVSFSLNGSDYSWDLRYDADWFDVLVIGRVNTLLKSMGCDKFFLMSPPGRIISIVFCTEETKTKLNSLISKPYILEFSEDDNKQWLPYSLRTNNGSFSNNMLCPGLFDLLLSSPEPDDFLVLDPETPLGSSTFIQAAFNTENNTKKKTAKKKSRNTIVYPGYPYTIEAGFGGKRRSLAVYRMYTKDKDVVLQHFIDYWRDQKVPDISTWENVSDELKH